MNHAVHNKIVSFIWSIADDCLRDIYVRSKYRDVILPMVVLRRLDTLLEPSKDKVMEEVAFQKDDLNLTKIDKAIALQEQMIDKLKEYKATFINSAVTGKIKVLMPKKANTTV